MTFVGCFFVCVCLYRRSVVVCSARTWCSCGCLFCYMFSSDRLVVGSRLCFLWRFGCSSYLGVRCCACGLYVLFTSMLWSVFPCFGFCWSSFFCGNCFVALSLVAWDDGFRVVSLILSFVGLVFLVCLVWLFGVLVDCLSSFWCFVGSWWFSGSRWCGSLDSCYFRFGSRRYGCILFGCTIVVCSPLFVAGGVWGGGVESVRFLAGWCCCLRSVIWLLLILTFIYWSLDLVFAVSCLVVSVGLFWFARCYGFCTGFCLVLCVSSGGLLSLCKFYDSLCSC